MCDSFAKTKRDGGCEVETKMKFDDGEENEIKQKCKNQV